MPTPSWVKLRSLSDEDLIAVHDRQAETTTGGVDYYLDELRHRELMGTLKNIAEQLGVVVITAEDERRVGLTEEAKVERE